MGARRRPHCHAKMELAELLQWIVVALIVAAAVGYALRGLAHALRRRRSSSKGCGCGCGGCDGCDGCDGCHNRTP